MMSTAEAKRRLLALGQEAGPARAVEGAAAGAAAALLAGLLIGSALRRRRKEPILPRAGELLARAALAAAPLVIEQVVRHSAGSARARPREADLAPAAFPPRPGSGKLP